MCARKEGWLQGYASASQQGTGRGGICSSALALTERNFKILHGELTYTHSILLYILYLYTSKCYVSMLHLINF